MSCPCQSSPIPLAEIPLSEDLGIAYSFFLLNGSELPQESHEQARHLPLGVFGTKTGSILPADIDLSRDLGATYSFILAECDYDLRVVRK